MNKWVVRGIIAVIIGGAAWYFVGDPRAAAVALLALFGIGKSDDDKARDEDKKKAKKDHDEVKKAKGKKKGKLMDKIFNRNLSTLLFVLLLSSMSFLCVVRGETNSPIETKVLEPGDTAEETLYCYDNDDADKITRLVLDREIFKKDNERRAKAERRWKIKAWSGTAAGVFAVVGAGFKLSNDRDFQKIGNGFLVGGGVMLVINFTI